MRRAGRCRGQRGPAKQGPDAGDQCGARSGWSDQVPERHGHEPQDIGDAVATIRPSIRSARGAGRLPGEQPEQQRRMRQDAVLDAGERSPTAGPALQASAAAAASTVHSAAIA